MGDPKRIIRVKRADVQARKEARKVIDSRVREHLESEVLPEPVFRRNRVTGEAYHYVR